MILILGQRYGDNAADSVMDWLEYYGHKYVRINGVDLVTTEGLEYDFGKNSFKIGNFNSTEITKIWFRRWANRANPIQFNEENEEIDLIQLNDFSKSEFNGLREYFFESLRDKKWLDKPMHFYTRKTSKASQLRIAQNLGLKIPNTMISGDKIAVQKFIKENDNQVIIKNIKEVKVFFLDGEQYATYTKDLTVDEVEKLPASFQPILLQSKIEKQFEVRVFHILGKNYSMAMFSQMDSQTKVDFRVYNYEKPQRWIPFKLPEDIDKKITELMNVLELNSSSIDLIYSKEGVFYFLEANIFGQFGMVSHNCNYYLDEIIAKNIISL